jgi:hypothetical protein
MYCTVKCDPPSGWHGHLRGSSESRNIQELLLTLQCGLDDAQRFLERGDQPVHGDPPQSSASVWPLVSKHVGPNETAGQQQTRLQAQRHQQHKARRDDRDQESQIVDEEEAPPSDPVADRARKNDMVCVHHFDLLYFSARCTDVAHPVSRVATPTRASAE